jgi:hypothetical protein
MMISTSKIAYYPFSKAFSSNVIRSHYICMIIALKKNPKPLAVKGFGVDQVWA